MRSGRFLAVAGLDSYRLALSGCIPLVFIVRNPQSALRHSPSWFCSRALQSCKHLLEGFDPVDHAELERFIGQDHPALAEVLFDVLFCNAVSDRYGFYEIPVVGVHFFLNLGPGFIRERLEGIALGLESARRDQRRLDAPP